MNKISVIIPTYKRPEQTARTINHLFQSKGLGDKFEMEVIVSDCTEDESVKNKLKEKFGEKVAYTRPENPGVASNKNQGAKIAKNPILVFADSDMEVEEDTLLSCIDYLKTHPHVAALTTNVVWRGNENEGELDRPRDEDRLLNYKDTDFTEFIYSRFKVAYKKVFEEVGGYDEEVFNMRGEGSDLSTRYWRAGFPLAYNFNTRVHHHEIDEGIGSTAAHPEWGVAKDYLLLGYKYGNYEGESDYFAKTIGENMENYDSDRSHFRVLQGIAKNYELVSESKKIIDKQKQEMNPEYDFNFMEVFSDEERLKKCIDEAEKRLKSIKID